MKRAVLVVACVIGICAGVLICLLFQHVLQAETGAKGNGFGAAAEWKALSIQERTSYVEGYVVGYGVGSSDVCEDADRLFATAGPVYLKDGTLNNPVTICKASLDHFTRMGKRGEVRPNYSVYSDVITDFYNKYPKYSNMPFSFLLAMLSDKNFKTADQLFQKLERHDMQLTYQAQQNDKRTDVMLYDGVPVQPVEAGVQSSMNWHLVKSADTAAQADANEHPWSHEDIQSINSMHSSNPILPLAFDLC